MQICPVGLMKEV